MTDNEFTLCMLGEGEAHVGTGEEQTRLRYIFADAIDQLAKEKQAAGRPDRASLLRYLSGKWRYSANGHQLPSKKSIQKAKREIEELRRRLVDGVSLTGR
jgi:hypothetical protein